MRRRVPCPRCGCSVKVAGDRLATHYRPETRLVCEESGALVDRSGPRETIHWTRDLLEARRAASSDRLRRGRHVAACSTWAPVESMTELAAAVTCKRCQKMKSFQRALGRQSPGAPSIERRVSHGAD